MTQMMNARRWLNPPSFVLTWWSFENPLNWFGISMDISMKSTETWWNVHQKNHLSLGLPFQSPSIGAKSPGFNGEISIHWSVASYLDTLVLKSSHFRFVFLAKIPDFSSKNLSVSTQIPVNTTPIPLDPLKRYLENPVFMVDSRCWMVASPCG